MKITDSPQLVAKQGSVFPVAVRLDGRAVPGDLIATLAALLIQRARYRLHESAPRAEPPAD
jgi:hypothetical protein